MLPHALWFGHLLQNLCVFVYLVDCLWILSFFGGLGCLFCGFCCLFVDLAVLGGFASCLADFVVLGRILHFIYGFRCFGADLIAADAPPLLGEK